MRVVCKKIIIIVICFLEIFCLFSCGKKNRTTIKSKEEWDALFDHELFEHVDCRKIQGALGINENSLMNYLRNGDFSQVTYAYPGGQFKHYYIKDVESNSLIAYYEIGKDIYEKSIIEYDENENVDDYFYDMFVIVSGELDYKDYYDVAEYDEMKECYRFEVIEEDETILVELYIIDRKIVKKILYYSIDDEDNADITIYDYDSEFQIELPKYKTTVSSNDEWNDLFDLSKYMNSSIYIEQNDQYLCHYLTDNVISTIKIDEEGIITCEYITNSGDFSNIQYKKQIDSGEYIEEPFNYSHYPGVTNFDELKKYFVSNGLTGEYESFIDKYEELETGEDCYYYIQEVLGATLKHEFYLSNGYLYKIIKNVDYDDGSSDYSTFSFSDIGMTTIDEVE